MSLSVIIRGSYLSLSSRSSRACSFGAASSTSQCTRRGSAPAPTKTRAPFVPPVGAPKFDPTTNKEADAIDRSSCGWPR